MTAKKQREALVIITEGLFRSDSFRVSPDFMRKLASDRLERDALYLSSPQGIPSMVELALPDRVLAVQRDVLNRLMSPTVARRIVEVNAQSPQGVRGCSRSPTSMAPCRSLSGKKRGAARTPMSCVATCSANTCVE